MSDSVRLFKASDPEWNTWILTCDHDFYHRSEYHALWSGLGTAFLAVCGHAHRFVAWPYILQPLAGCEGIEGCDLNDVTSVYGYAGPLTRGIGPGDPFVAVACRAFADLWRSQRAVSVFTRFHPLLQNHRLLERVALDGAGSEGISICGHTVSIDLRASEEEILRDYRRSIRQQLRSARALAFISATDTDWTSLPEFIELLRATMDRNHAEPQYYLSASFFERFRRLLPKHLFLRLTTDAGKVVSGMIYFEYGKTVHALYGATDSAYVRRHAYKICIDEGWKWAQERGNEIFHLGGGRGGRDDDTLFYFKTAFSPRRHPFAAGHWVLNDQAYADLCRQRSDYLRARGTAPPRDRFFPEYRAPLGDYGVKA